MNASRIARITVLGASAALAATAVVAGSASAAPAAPAVITNSSPISYTCTLPVPNAPSGTPLSFTVENTFTVQKAVPSGEGAPAVPITDALVFTPDAESALASLITAAGVSAAGGTLDGGFGLYGAAYDATFALPPMQPTDLTALLGTPLTVTGSMPAPASGKGPEQLTAPTFIFVTFPELGAAKLGCYNQDTNVIGDLVLRPHAAAEPGKKKGGKGHTGTKRPAKRKRPGSVGTL